MMRKKLFDYTKLTVTLFLMTVGFLNAQKRSISTSDSKNSGEISKSLSPELKASPLTNIQQGNPLEMMKGKTEDLSKRTVDSKHFKNSDGSFTAIIGGGALHYTKNGKWEDINTQIKKTSSLDFAYENTANLMESYFGSTSQKGIVSKTKDGEIAEFLNTKMYWEVNNKKVGEISGANVVAVSEGEKVIYPHLFGNINAEYAVNIGQRKLNYIIPTKADLGKIPANANYLVFSEDILLPKGWSYETLPNKGILIKNDLREIIYTIDAPTTNDQKDLGLYNNNTIYSIKKVGNYLRLETKVEFKWLNDNSRIFPINVDPTTTYTPLNIARQTYQMNSAGGGATGSPAAGKNGTTWFRGFINFDLSSIPASSVSDVKITLTAGNVQGVFNATYPLGITQSNYNLTYWSTNNTTLYNYVTNVNNTGGDYISISATPVVGTPITYTLPTAGQTDVAKKTGSSNSFFSVTLRQGWNDTVNQIRYVVYRDHTHATDNPKLIVTYTQNDIYCHPGYTDSNCATLGDCRYVGITNVTIGSINNTTTNNNIPIGYNRYSLSTNVNTGSSYPLNVRYTDSGAPVNPGRIAAWVDWNEDGDFADANEFIGVLNASSNNQVLVFNVNVPTGTSPGTKRLRIRSTYNSTDALDTITSNDYCKILANGETEDYDLVILGDPILNVTNAYTGASYANGNHTIANNTSVTATSGTRAGYNILGWVGTGNVPATGTTGSSTFTITQNSTIDWKWQQIGLPNNIAFHNYGGTEQLAFNNSRIATTPIFRLSHGTDPATEYDIEINTLPNFSGTSFTQTFTGAYPLNTQANFTFNSGFAPISGTTYYVRARVKGAADTFNNWTTETYSFTYETPKDKPDWFQTTQAQFTTDALSGTTADASNDVVVTSTGGNVITNGSFETNTSGWTRYTINAGDYPYIRSTAWATDGSSSLRIYNNRPDSFGYMSADRVIITQNVNLTGVSNLLLDARYVGTGTRIVQLRVFVTDPSQASSVTSGTLLTTWTPPLNTSTTSINIDLTSYNFVGNKAIQLVYWVTGSETVFDDKSIYIDNVRTTSLPQGTITSTPIALSSVQNVTRFEKIRWNQTLGGGTLNFKIQQTTLGGNTWTDVAGYTNISATGDGIQEFDLSGMTGYPQIRLVGTLNGANVKMHDWAIIYEESCDKTWSGSTIDWSIGSNWTPNGIPTENNCVKIPSITIKPTIQIGANALAKNLTVESGGQLNIKGNLTVTDFIINNGAATDFIVESDANLIQSDPLAANIGNITLKRDSKMKRLDYIYWGSPVSGQNFISFSPNTVASRFYRYIEEFDSFQTILNLTTPMIAGEGYAIRAPNNQNATTPSNWTGLFVGKPNNGEVTFPVTKHTDSPIDPNDPFSEIISRGKNMLSNPYPSNLDLEALTDANPAIANGVYYFWTNTNDFVDNTQVPGNGTYGNYGSNHYATYNSTGSVPAANAVNGQLPTRFIKPGQGFLFEAKTGGTVIFNNLMRSADPDSHFISNKRTENSPERFWLKLTTPINNTNTLLIAYISGATNLFDPRYDAKFPQKSSDRFYSIIEDKELIIQGRQYPFAKTDLVTLGMAHFVAGNYKIEIADREGIFSSGQNIYLKDKQTNMITNLSQESYTYTAEAGENNTRFEIIYQPETVLVTNQAVKGEFLVYRDASDFVVKSKDQTIENIDLYDAAGRLALHIKGNNSKELRFGAEKLTQGMYIIKVVTKAGVVTKKIIKY